MTTYRVGEDECVQALWALAATNERVSDNAGTLQIRNVSPAPALGSFEGRIRASAAVGGNTRQRSNSRRRHFSFPNFHEADYGNGIVYGTVVVPVSKWDWRDISASELGNPSGAEARFRAVNDYARTNGFGAAMPNFHEADRDGLVYGTILFHADAMDFRDVPASELGNPSSREDRFRAANDYANRHGFEAGFPNFHEVNPGNGVEYGIMLFRRGTASVYDVNRTVLSVMGSNHDFQPQIDVTPWQLEVLPGLDANSPQLEIEAPS